MDDLMSKLKTISAFTAFQKKQTADRKKSQKTVILSSGTCGQACGSLKVEELAHHKSPVALQMMRAIKQALDPMGLFNPGRVLPR